MAATAGLIRGDNRYDNVRAALDLVADDIGFDGGRQVLIKPNLVAHRQLAATHNDALCAVLDFARARALRRAGGGSVWRAGMVYRCRHQQYPDGRYDALHPGSDATRR